MCRCRGQNLLSGDLDRENRRIIHHKTILLSLSKISVLMRESCRGARLACANGLQFPDCIFEKARPHIKH